MLPGSFEDELDFFAESGDDRTNISAPKLRRDLGRKNLRSRPEKKYHPASRYHCYYYLRPGSFCLRLTLRHVENGLWRRTQHRCGRL